MITHVLFQFSKKEHSKAVNFTHKCSLGFQDQLSFQTFGYTSSTWHIFMEKVYFGATLRNGEGGRIRKSNGIYCTCTFFNKHASVSREYITLVIITR